MADRRKPETTRQARIVAALRKAGHVVHRLHSGKVKVRGGWMVLEPEGTPDLLLPGVAYLETKTPTGRLSAAQEAMHAKLQRATKLPVFVVRTAAEALERAGVWRRT